MAHGSWLMAHGSGLNPGENLSALSPEPRSRIYFNFSGRPEKST